MKTTVIVVDDYLPTATDCAELIKAKTELEVAATDRADEAVELIKNNPIHVAVLDQNMPKKGTELYRELKTIDPHVKVIMFSGEATREEVGQALSFGFDDYIHKNKVEELPERVIARYIDYEATLAEKIRDQRSVLLYRQRKGVPLGNRVAVRLVSIETVRNDHIFADSWETIKQIVAGERAKDTDEMQVTRRYIHESESEERLATQLSLGLPQIKELQGKMEAEVSQRYKDQTFEEGKKIHKVEREFKLPDEPNDPNTLHIVSRHYQRAPVYRELRCLLIRDCECCGKVDPVPVQIYQLTSKIATRQHNHYSDGSTRTVETGKEVHQR